MRVNYLRKHNARGGKDLLGLRSQVPVDAHVRHNQQQREAERSQHDANNQQVGDLVVIVISDVIIASDRRQTVPGHCIYHGWRHREFCAIFTPVKCYSN